MIERMEELMAERNLSTRSQKQYLAVAGRFQAFGQIERKWTDGPTDLRDLAESLELWFAKQNGLSQATMTAYRSALALYSRAAGFPVDIADLVKTPVDIYRRAVKALSDTELRELRKATGADYVLRTAAELAIAGLKASDIAGVGEATIKSTSKASAYIQLTKSRQVEVFDEVSAAWLGGPGRKNMPASHEYSETRVLRRISKLVRRVTGREGGVRELRLTGVRRAIAKGISRERVADSIGVGETQASWRQFPVRPSRSPETREVIPLPPPVPPDDRPVRRLSTRESMKLTEEEYAVYLDQLLEAD